MEAALLLVKGGRMMERRGFSLHQFPDSRKLCRLLYDGKAVDAVFDGIFRIMQSEKLLHAPTEQRVVLADCVFRVLLDFFPGL